MGSRMTIADISPKPKAKGASFHVIPNPETRMTQALHVWIANQLKDGVSFTDVMVALDNATRHVELLRSLS